MSESITLYGMSGYVGGGATWIPTQTFIGTPATPTTDEERDTARFDVLQKAIAFLEVELGKLPQAPTEVGRERAGLEPKSPDAPAGGGA